MANYPQIVTQIGDFGVEITTQVDAPWVSVTSVNGMTGDVSLDPTVGGFEPNHHYLANTIIIEGGTLYYATSEFTSGATFDASDWTEITPSTSWSAITGKPDFATVATSGLYSDLTGIPNLATVATSGDYSDLSGTPDLADIAISGDYSDLINAPILSTVATTGDYDDLSNKPAINNGTLTIERNGSSIATFSANSSDNKTANIEEVFPRWSQLYHNGVEDEASLTWTTPGGLTLTYEITLGGAISVLSGASSVLAYRYSFSQSSSGLNRPYGMFGLALNTTHYSRIIRQSSNGTWSGGFESQIASGDSDIIDIANVTGNKSYTAGQVTFFRANSSATRWEGFGTIGSAGALDLADFQFEVYGRSVDSLPGVYQRGASSTTATNAWALLEILETTNNG